MGKLFRKQASNDIGVTQIVPIVLAVIIVFCILFVGAYVNGIINAELNDGLAGYDTTGPTGNANTMARWRMNNTSWNWDSAIDIVQVVIIITVLATAIGAIFLFTRYR